MNEADARKYMELAVAEMHKSVREPRTDGKLTPKVGVVLVMEDGEVIAAHRGELRDGEHAEFTLLERKCGNRNLAEAALFTTLEPCSPEARTPPKSGCAKHIVRARIKQVWVGREDPYPTVAKQGLRHLEDNGVEVNLFDSDLQDEIERENADYIKQAEEAAAAWEDERALEKQPLSALDEAAPVTLADFSESALAAYKRELGIEDDERLQRTLVADGLLVKENGGFRPSGFATLLFGKTPRSRFPQAGVLATIRYPNGDEEIEDFDGPLVEIPDEVEEWLKNKLPNLLNTDQMKSTSGENLPLVPLREGLVNALIHRDYEIEGAKVQLTVTPDAYVIESPGKPHDPIKVEKMASFSSGALSQNPKLAHVFRQMHLAEERNRGMAALRDVQKRGDLVPTITYDEPYLTLALHRTPGSAADEVAGSRVADQLTADELEGWSLLRRVGSITTAEYMSERGVAERTARRHLNKFVSLGLATREGRGPSTRYSAVVAVGD
jgi:ATP-dependent DNA helicase RecG